MRLWTIILFSCFMVLISPVCRAGDGICHAVKGTYIYNLNLNDARIPAEKNKAGTEVRDLETLTSSESYNIAVPFEAEPNVVKDGMNCYTDTVEGNLATLYTGSEVKVSFLINKPFVGQVAIPGTIVANLYGGLDASSSTASTDKLAEVRIVGDIVAPQSCEIDSGQVIEVNFGKIPVADFSTTQGTAAAGHKVTKTVQVKCTGMLDENIVYSTFNADPVDSSANMMKVLGNDDVGIMIYDKWDRMVKVTGGKMDMDMGVNNGGAETNSLTFSAAPASATGARPQPGTFEAYATITLEITN
ncbi:probable fimbrial protein [Salmonella enterica subsp. enterica serovar Typhi]|nr:probable fimbrial protein [Salmonella enterica subsp. enterica serovar Typhi]